MKTLLLLALAAAAAHAQDTEFRVTSAFPKYETADIEFRDASGAKWPSFLHGKPANDTGALSFDPAKPAATFVLLCDKAAQDKGDQTRRVLGALPQPHTATLTITAMTAPQPAAKSKSKATHTAELTGTLEIAGKKIPVRAVTGLWLHDGKGDEKNRALMLDGTFALKGADLGLRDIAQVEVRFGLTAYPPR